MTDDGVVDLGKETSRPSSNIKQMRLVSEDRVLGPGGRAQYPDRLMKHC